MTQLLDAGQTRTVKSLLFVVTVSGFVRGDDEVIVEQLDKVMDELDHLRAADPVIDLDLEKHEVRLQAMVKAEDPITAVNYASGLFRSAIHAVGGATPNWPELDDEVWAIQLVGVTSTVVYEDVD